MIVLFKSDTVHDAPQELIPCLRCPDTPAPSWNIKISSQRKSSAVNGVAWHVRSYDQFNGIHNTDSSTLWPMKWGGRLPYCSHMSELARRKFFQMKW